MAKRKSKNQSIKKLVIVLLCIIGFILAILYFYKWHQVKEQEKYMNSYLVASNTINLEIADTKEIRDVLSEASDDYFIYISYTKDKDVYELEKDLKPIIDEYNLKNIFYFLNVTEAKNKTNYIKDIADKLNIKESEIYNVPIILYFKDGKLINKGVTNAKDFEALLEMEDLEPM